MKLKYRLRNMFFPRKHDKLVYEIWGLLVELKCCRAQINAYEKLMDRVILGDRIWENYEGWYRNLRYYNRLLKEKKEQWKSKQSGVWRISKNPT